MAKRTLKTSKLRIVVDLWNAGILIGHGHAE